MSYIAFTAWMMEVDEHVYSRVGCSVNDLEDWSWRDMYDEGYYPNEAADEALDQMGLHMSASVADPGL